MIMMNRQVKVLALAAAALLMVQQQGTEGFRSSLLPPPVLRRNGRRNAMESELASRSSSLSSTIPNINNSNNDNSYLRWNKSSNRNRNQWEMQTAVTVFENKNKNQTIELHAQLHFGNLDYFEYYNAPDFNDRYDAIMYELLTDESLLSFQDGKWRLSSPIMASPQDEQLAQSYGWKCQVNSIDYTQNKKWIHADLTRQEFIKLSSSNNKGGDSNQPLWQLASTSPQSSSAAAEAVSALLVGPPILSYSSKSNLKRRLFTNLFLPGNALANGLRAILWMTVPAPELSIILLDWSSLLQQKKGDPNALSEVALPILTSMTKFDFHSIRRFLFGQVLVSSSAAATKNNNDNTDGWTLLVTKRNDHALNVVKKTLLQETGAASRAALLYGSSHCPDLHQKLVASGYQPVKKEWRTAWSIDSDATATTNNLPMLLTIPFFYLAVGAFDWIEMMGDVSQAWEEQSFLDVSFLGGFYLLRHALLYLGLSKFLIDWNDGNANPK